ncbi:odorant receptor 131-2-like [Discoglossus pictus]
MSSFMVTPCNLAVMALERYVAICFPLRHTEICTVRKSTMSIAMMWATALVPVVADTTPGVILISFFIFLYYIIIILRVYFTTSHLQETSRYVLFIHMITNDTVYLFISVLLYGCSLFLLLIPLHFCYILITLSTVTFRVTPYNLAVMSLERYVAVCFPLRHLQFCTVRRTTAAIAVVWLIALIPNVADIIALNSLGDKKLYSLNVICNRVTTTMAPVQNTIRSFSLSISFSLVGLIIIFSYLKVIQVARKIGSDKSSAKKASKTILLQVFQLLLCMTSLTSSISETYFKDYIKYIGAINFLMFMCLPRFLSSLVYGLRDNAFRKYLKQLGSAELGALNALYLSNEVGFVKDNTKKIKLGPVKDVN